MWKFQDSVSSVVLVLDRRRVRGGLAVRTGFVGDRCRRQIPVGQ